MKTLILAAFAVLSLGVGVLQTAQAAPFHSSMHQGPYDNTGNSQGGGWSGGGGG
jgi:hypothetical protein